VHFHSPRNWNKSGICRVYFFCVQR
jgi:hypothetical protein